MNGVAAIRQLLIGNVGLTNIVPAANVVAGILPKGSPVPALSIMSVSTVDVNIPSPGAKRRVVERVQVSGVAATYPELKALMKAVKQAASAQMPTVSGISEVTVHTDSAGPDFTDEAAALCFGSQDFKVAYNELT